jgi:predicted ATP-grasp superfamily ATP-dependent carboligase
MEVVLMENIPGPDSRLCSYYTYLDEEGDALFDFTKRIIRRYPVNMGLGSYHITDHVEGVRELALKLFRHVGLQGLANAEFKYDDRDGQLKLIECNARFTAANSLVAKAGFDLGTFVYNRIVGIPQPPFTTFRTGLRMWDPLRDFRAFLELRARGEMTLIEWLASIMHPTSISYFSWRDPLPSFVRLTKRARVY